MTQEDKNLLLKDLCARLPYGVKIELTWWFMGEGTCINPTLEPNHIEQLLKDDDIEIKPYLRPLSSMTDNEDKLLHFLTSIEGVDWLNAHHFDYRGLISKGLAIKAPVGMYN